MPGRETSRDRVPRVARNPCRGPEERL